MSNRAPEHCCAFAHTGSPQVVKGLAFVLYDAWRYQEQLSAAAATECVDAAMAMAAAWVAHLPKMCRREDEVSPADEVDMIM